MYLKKLSKPRESVFNKDRRDVALALSDFLESKNAKSKEIGNSD